MNRDDLCIPQQDDADEAAGTRKDLRHLDNHLLRDIGMPERQRRIRFGPY